MDKFKHINDTSFPNINTVDVYSYENTFDYNKWDIDTEIRILDVPWDGFDNAIKFETDEVRDRWIEEHTAEKYVLDTEQYLQPDGRIKLPIPFNVACLYNYIAIKYPVAPVSFANDERIDRYFYFITNTKQLAPSTTECTLMLDAWTTYQNRIDIKYFMLERGHAPMSEIDAAKFIKNPIDNSAGILAPDVNYEGAPNIMGGWIPAKKYLNVAEWIANDKDMYIVLAMSGQAAADWGTVETDSMHVPSVITPNFFGGIGYDYIAIKESNFSIFYRNVLENIPQLLPTVAGIFIISRKLLDFKESFTLAGTTVHFIDTTPKKYTVLNLNLDMFDFDDKYKDIAKLYTFPYSSLEMTDERGNTTKIPIEQTNGKIDIAASLNLFMPFLGLDVMPVNIGGDAVNTKFMLTRNRDFVHGGNWYTAMHHWDIPTFAVFQDQQSASKYNRYFQNKQRETERDNNYDSSLASNATANTNALASNATAYDNAIASNATANTNALATNATNCANALASNATNYDNVAREIANTTANVNLTNSNETYKVDTLQNGGSVSDIGGSGGFLAATYAANRDKISYDIDADQKLMYQVQGITNSTLAAGGVINAGSSAVSGAAGGAMMGSSMGAPGAIGGAIVGGVTSGISSAAGTMIALTQNESLVAKNKEHADAKYRNARDNMIAMWHAQTAYTSGIKNADNDLRTNTNNNDVNTRTANNNATKTTEDSIANNTRSTADANANRTKGTADANAARTKGTADANANRTKATEDANAGRRYDTATKAIDRGNRAQWTLAPDMIGTIDHAGSAATKPMGLFFNIVKQSDTALAQAGDQMLRYGYMLNSSWEIKKLQLMKCFTYWKASDIWLKIDGEASAPKRDATENIKDMFKNGITIWDDPDKIGHVSIYENI